VRVIVAGGHGKIGQLLLRALAERGDTGVGLVRNPDHVDELAALGAEAVVLDLEHASPDEVRPVVAGADAVVFAAGAGAKGGIERKDSVDRATAVLTAEAAELEGVRRYLQVSSFGAGEEVPEGTDETFTAYLRAKTAAEDDLRGRAGLDWTILRPTTLTDEPGTGQVTLSTPPLETSEVSRADVAAVLVALLDAPGTAGSTLMLTKGTTPVADAVAAHAS
jgi:uncharacterized protein YbjT (DUF2867 family)